MWVVGVIEDSVSPVDKPPRRTALVIYVAFESSLSEGAKRFNAWKEEEEVKRSEEDEEETNMFALLCVVRYTQ
ncbi:hypothetical protein E2C01_074851 [Portunus trituberculatus]|uniref:Uncharacterized protein n=1 Tax=Portunus trituberculatus TaxID=210409 RepID=A0A5B7IFC8_PORTR|nr:hypothetical protein [Portunus trituberculatus]